MPVRVLAAAMFAVSSLPAEAAVTLLGGGPPGSIAEAIAAAVPGALPAGHPVVVEKPAPDASPLDALEHGRAAAAVLHGDIFRNAAKRSSAIADLEYFPLRRACFVLLVPIDSAADASALLAASAAPSGGTIDIGSAGSLTAGSWAVLSAAYPPLASIRTETRGGMRAVARLLNQQVSAVLLSSLEIVPGDVSTNAVIDGLARMIPLGDEALWQAADAAGLGYQRRQLTIEDAKDGGPKLTDEALCTDLGIAVSDAASPGISEAIAAAASEKRLSGDARSLVDSMYDLWSISVSEAAGAIGWALKKGGQAAQEIAPRWFARP
ncbi:hypothetical protein GGE65_001930 [Skermanella aerolata]|uniref:Uncharacterized protein n=1 Tax=Skermanella aerolata TaxID=393310 RepID=A0A512DP85_9PROT|nr:hypothetical protein [Skermanella aerolata]KJB95892.1 hypothetical protein N826_39985 [Skermanella aerolata KACC 11604]GEO38295.1 hypothetical protein SAE02_24430 [Skermanella aerolata]